MSEQKHALVRYSESAFEITMSKPGILEGSKRIATAGNSLMPDETRHKLGNRITDLLNTFQSIENPAAFMEAVAEMESALRGMSLSMSAHPDCEDNSEFADYVDTANEALEMYEAAKGAKK